MKDARNDHTEQKAKFSERTKDWAKRIIFVGSLVGIGYAVKWEVGRRQAHYRKWQIEQGLMPPESVNWPLK